MAKEKAGVLNVVKTVYPRPQKPTGREKMEYFDKRKEENKKERLKQKKQKGPELRDKDGKVIRAIAGASVPPNRKAKS